MDITDDDIEQQICGSRTPCCCLQNCLVFTASCLSNHPHQNFCGVNTFFTCQFPQNQMVSRHERQIAFYIAPLAMILEHAWTAGLASTGSSSISKQSLNIQNNILGVSTSLSSTLYFCDHGRVCHDACTIDMNASNIALYFHSWAEDPPWLTKWLFGMLWPEICLKKKTRKLHPIQEALYCWWWM